MGLSIFEMGATDVFGLLGPLVQLNTLRSLYTAWLMKMKHANGECEREISSAKQLLTRIPPPPVGGDTYSTGVRVGSVAPQKRQSLYTVLAASNFP